MDFEFCYIDAHTLPACLAMLRRFFGENYYGADERYVNWQYRDSVFTKEMVGPEKYSMLAIVSNGEILALDAFLPWKTLVNGRLAQTIWDIEWMSSGKERGLGRKLVAELRSRADIYCGYGMNSLSRSSYSTLGYSMTEAVERRLAIIDPQACFQLFGESDSSKQAFLSRVADKTRSPRPLQLESVGSISEDYFHSQRDRFEALSYKGRDYLQWRFLGHPYLRYNVLALDDKAEKGLAVVRLERIKGRKETVLRILDMMPVPGNEQELALAVLAFGREEGAVLADFFCASQAYAALVCPHPFVPLEEHVAYDVPMLFQPLEIRERKSINMVLDVSLPFSGITFDNFFATKADGDQDVRLNTDYTTLLL